MTEEYFGSVIKEQLKKAREKRGAQPAGLASTLKEHALVQKALLTALAAGPKTVPQLAKETGIPAPVVLWHVTALRKYNKVGEGAKQGDYWTYLVRQA